MVDNLQLQSCADCVHYGKRCTTSPNGCQHYEYDASGTHSDKLVDTYRSMVERLIREKSELCHEIASLKKEIAGFMAEKEAAWIRQENEK